MATLWRQWIDAAFVEPVVPAPSAAAKDSPSLALGAVVATVLFGRALQLSNGMYFDPSMTFLSYGAVAALAGLLMPRHPRIEQAARTLLPPAIFIGLVMQVGMLHGSMPLKYMTISTRWQADAFHYGVAALAIVVAGACGPWPWMKRYHGPVMALVFVFLGYWLVDVSPNPHIDVIVWHREAMTALLDGINPYSISVPNIYGDDKAYGPGLVRDGRVLIGYVYPPINLLLCMLGNILGDCRYALSAAIAIGAGCVMFVRRTWLAAGAMGLLMLTPRGLFAIENAWIEPFAFMFLCATLMVAQRWPRYLPVPLGLLLVCKQYMPVLAPLAFLLPALRGGRQQVLKQIGMTVVVGACITLPFIVWSPSDFWRSVIKFHMDIGFRADALTYLAWWNAYYGTPPSTHWAYPLALGAMALIAWRAPRTPAGMAFGLGFVFFVLVAFNSQAFCNYYWLVMGCMLAAVATSDFDAVTETPLPKKSGKRSRD